MNHSPENEQNPAPRPEPTEHPTVQLPTAPPPQPQPVPPQPVPPQQAQQQAPQPYPQPYPQQPPVGWGHPAPSQPAGPPSSGPGTPHDPFVLLNASPAGPGAAPATTTTAPRKPRLWVTVVGAAAATALVTSLATLGLSGAFGGDGSATPSSLETIGSSSSDTAPVSGSSADNPDWEKVAAAVSASVVAIQVTTANGGAEGSGVIIDDAGHVLTNNHVVSGAADDTVQVTLSDGRLYDAKLVGTDPTTDLAVVQITDPPGDLKPAAFGDSGEVVVGEPVMAVGNPLGLANTVTTGIVSAVDRPVSASAETSNDTVVTNAIQIDAAINPGNSGGPLFDATGRVVGITSSIATLSGGGSQSGSIGLGFAIPINLAQNIASQLVESGTAEHAFLGVSLTDGDATADGTTRLGAVVEDVTSGSPAAKAKVQQGDVIVAIDGRPVAGAESLTAYVRERTAGSTAELTVVRDGSALDLTVTFATKATTVEENSSEGQDGDGQSQNPFDQFFGGQG